MKPTKANIRKWVQALRSGEYNQTKGALQDVDGYCCLGVGCRIFIPENQVQLANGHVAGGYPSVQSAAPVWLKQIDENFYRMTDIHLSSLNDTGYDPASDFRLHGEKLDRFTFDEIADLIEMVYLHKVLT